MYGILGKLLATPGNRERLAQVLVAGSRDMPGNLAYVVALDEADELALWVTEVWASREEHQASLQLPQVQAAIGEARGEGLIAGFGERFETRPLPDSL
ncbi:antibiotic biosynthesis monooxygenase [Mangrovimicrobium sediminis]|uniref:Antibiotic biosynthesis monooxygenase n=1 Tax=Mangrovimicrobium sediminis TaxID=2562682 RepID=A0A4Z0M4F6_9GAMM|nr:putative quinol monooxygenase [Haliea sp. SAOS-164]TGD74320.1 antibiotic biosynthesis monooxygenase [Haliea sp. SAOS-164]